MKTWRRSLITLAMWMGAVLAGYLGYVIAQNQQFARAEEKRAEIRKGLAQAQELAAAFRDVGKLVEPSVVKIQVRKKMPSAGTYRFDDETLKRFFPDRNGDGEPDLPEGMPPLGLNPDEEDAVPDQEGTGSGVIMEADGSKVYILTNNHVAGGAEEMLITLNDGRQIRNGTLVGADAKTDLAVVRIEADRVATAKWGDSDALEKGDWVLAFGSPFGYVGSMTHGIVSATNRTEVGILGQGGYEDFIQVDAPINPGNSGGPLVNLSGEVVGVNTAIASRSGGFQGIGFAIPSNQAKTIYKILKEKGKVVRGWLGVGIRDLSKSPELARSFGLEQAKGVLVDQVFTGMPAAQKLRHGDIIVGINGKSIDDTFQLRQAIALLPPASDVRLNIWREGKTQEVTIKLGEQPDDVTAIRTGRGGSSEPSVTATPNSAEAQGLTVQTLTPQMAETRKLEVKSGVIVTRVDRNSAAAREGLRMGDVITEVGDTSVKSAEEFAAAMKKADLTKGVRLYVTSRDSSGEVQRFLFIRADK